MTCAELDAVAAELSLDLLTGEQRAEALAHVAECAACRARVAELTAAADRIVQMIPGAEPSAGFEERVLDALGPPPAAPRRSGRRPWFALAAAIVLVLGVAGALAIAARRDTGISPREAAMVTPKGDDVGDVYVSDDSPSWVFVSVPAWADRWGGKPYDLVLTLADGTTRTIAGGDLDAGHGAWGTVLAEDGANVRAVAMVGGDGGVWCSATLA